jgi:hypothetical protein
MACRSTTSSDSPRMFGKIARSCNTGGLNVRNRCKEEAVRLQTRIHDRGISGYTREARCGEPTSDREVNLRCNASTSYVYTECLMTSFGCGYALAICVVAGRRSRTPQTATYQGALELAWWILPLPPLPDPPPNDQTSLASLANYPQSDASECEYI